MISSNSGVLYIGMTNNLQRRIYEHKNNLINGFSKRYKCQKLIFFEESTDVMSVLNREKQLKKWGHQKKIGLARKINPNLEDLSTKLEMTDPMHVERDKDDG
jgi:putative endonuclease